MNETKTIAEIFPKKVLVEIERTAKHAKIIKASIFKEVLEKNIKEIEEFSGNEFDPMYLAYVLEYAFNLHK